MWEGGRGDKSYAQLCPRRALELGAKQQRRFLDAAGQIARLAIRGLAVAGGAKQAVDDPFAA